MIPWSIHPLCSTFPQTKKQKKNDKFATRAISLINSSPHAKAYFSKADTSYKELNHRCVAYNVGYLTYNLRYSIYEMTYLIDEVSNKVLYTNYIAFAIVRSRAE